MSPTGSDAVMPVVADAVRRSVRAVVAVMVCELVAETICATMCEVVAVMVAVMVSGTKTQMPGSMHSRAPATDPACASKPTMGKLAEMHLGQPILPCLQKGYAADFDRCN